MVATNVCQSWLQNHGNLLKKHKFPVKYHTNKKALVTTTILRYIKPFFRGFLRAGIKLQLFLSTRDPPCVAALTF
jgi:hypothetical protein